MTVYKYRDPERVHGTWLKGARDRAAQIEAEQKAAAEKDARRLILDAYMAGVIINHTRLDELAAGQP